MSVLARAALPLTYIVVSSVLDSLHILSVFFPLVLIQFERIKANGQRLDLR